MVSLSPNFDNDAFTHHVLHVLDAPGSADHCFMKLA